MVRCNVHIRHIFDTTPEGFAAGAPACGAAGISATLTQDWSRTYYACMLIIVQACGGRLARNPRRATTAKVAPHELDTHRERQ